MSSWYNERRVFPRSTYQEQTLARQQLQDDYEKLKRDEADKSAKLKELMLVMPRRHLDKAEKEVANLHTALKEADLGYMVPPRSRLACRFPREPPAKPAAPRSLHPLQLHLIISVSMILLTHRYPQIVVLV